jgi:uncharacterized protein YkwD
VTRVPIPGRSAGPAPEGRSPVVRAAIVGVIVAALLVLAASASMAGDVAAHPNGEQQLHELVNQARTDAGLQPLAPASDLQDNARRHAMAMATADRRWHQSDWSRVCCWIGIAENLFEARGIDTRSASALQEVMKRAHRRLMESSTHRANILNRDAHDIGIGVAVNHAAGTVWVVQVFRQRTDGPLQPAPTPPPLDPSPAPQAEREPASVTEPRSAEPTESGGRPLAAHESQRHDGMIDDPMPVHGPRRPDRMFGDAVAARAARQDSALVPHAEPATRATAATAAAVAWWPVAVMIAGVAATNLLRRR